MLEFPSPRHLSSSGSYPLDLSGLRGPTGSNTTASIALRVTGTHNTLHHGKWKIPLEGLKNMQESKYHTRKLKNIRLA
jgi:hypothetical protein